MDSLPMMAEIDRHEPAYVCQHVFTKEKPILFVCREDGDWQFLCGGLHEEDEIPHVVGIGHFFDTDPTLLSIATLQAGQEAERETLTSPWIIS
jgi:hypothetical protein